MDPVGSLIGTIFIGFGVMLLFGAVRNRRVFGADGILSQAISKGSLIPESEVPLAVAVSGIASGAFPSPGEEKGVKSVSKLEHALKVIKDVSKVLGDGIENELSGIYPGMPRQDLTPLAQLLTVADGLGLVDSTNVVRSHVQEVTGERV
jgi:hypothetical protein